MKDFVFFEFSTPHPWNMFLLLWLCFFLNLETFFVAGNSFFGGRQLVLFLPVEVPIKYPSGRAIFDSKTSTRDLEVVKARLTWKWSRLA